MVRLKPPDTTYLLQIAAEARVLDGELFDAGDERAVAPLLPLEIADAVFIQPPRERQEHAALDEQNQRSHEPPMAREPQVRLEPPVGFGAEKLGNERVLVGPIGRPAEQAVNGSEDLGVLVFRGAAACEQTAPQLVTHAILDLVHERLDTDDLVGQNACIVTGLVRRVRLFAGPYFVGGGGGGWAGGAAAA